jgi:hypothetical protein
MSILHTSEQGRRSRLPNKIPRVLDADRRPGDQAHERKQETGRLEGHHGAIGGNALRASVLGVTDGLVSNLSLVMGVAGAELAGRAILVTGMAGLLAGAAFLLTGVRNSGRWANGCRCKAHGSYTSARSNDRR